MSQGGDNLSFTIQNEDSIIEIKVINRPYADADDIWDINWLSCNVKIRIPCFTANFCTYITCNELKSFYDGLRIFHAELKGTVCLCTLEGGINVEASVDKLGHIEWKAEVQYPEGYGAELNFTFNTDQSYVYQILRDLKQTIDEYPIMEV